MSAAFTRGPWSFETHELSEGFSSIVYGANGLSLADHLSEADARLIATAPDLLAAAEAQEELVNFVGDDARPAIKRVQQMRRSAIAKARGES